MDSDEGRFHEVEKDGKEFELVYHHPQYDLISQNQWLTSHRQDHFQPLFLCPIARWRTAMGTSILNRYHMNSSAVISSPINNPSINNHQVIPMSWYNNKAFDTNSSHCLACYDSSWDTHYYFCKVCRYQFHKKCIESPPKIKHPYHPKHSLQLYFPYANQSEEGCYCCKRKADGLVYCCTTCKIFMHPVCAMKSIPFVIDPPKRHHHRLTFFPRQSCLTCNVCGLLRESNHTYICVRCNFVAHNDCMHSPHIIRISRHLHRISYIASLSSRGLSCGVCHQRIIGDYGGYACNKCDNYVVHSKCALGKDVWDGQDLKDVPEEDSITPTPYDIISEGVIHYFLHQHHLMLEVNQNYDENKFCQACALPIFEGNTYSCKNCDYILHEICANAPRIIQHALHPHTLTLKSTCHGQDDFYCNACTRLGTGYFYKCCKGCYFRLDIQCGLISEQFMYHGHKHPLFFGLEQVKTPICHVCNIECPRHFKCIECSTCDYVVCIKCATIPYKVRYKHDSHWLTFSSDNKVSENDCCEVCEYNLKDSRTKGLYWCKECCTTLHVECVFGEDPYLKAGQYSDFKILKGKKKSRAICYRCEKQCQREIIVFRDVLLFCSIKCLYRW